MELIVQIKKKFQSTLPRGERPYTGGYGGSITDFNPRSHEGSDMQLRRCPHGRRKNFNPRSHEGSDNLHMISYTGY